MFGKKKNEFKMIHFEGVSAFPADTETKVSWDDSSITFENKNKSTATLQGHQIQSIDFMDEKMFMAKYKGNASQMKIMGQKRFFLEIIYRSNSGEEKLISLYQWVMAVDNGAIKRFRKQFLNTAAASAQNIEL